MNVKVSDLSLGRPTKLTEVQQLGALYYELLTGFTPDPEVDEENVAYYFPASVSITKGGLEIIKRLLHNTVTLPDLLDMKFKYARFSTVYVLNSSFGQKPGRPMLNPVEHEKFRDLDIEEFDGPYDALK